MTEDKFFIFALSLYHVEGLSLDGHKVDPSSLSVFGINPKLNGIGLSIIFLHLIQL